MTATSRSGRAGLLGLAVLALIAITTGSASAHEGALGNEAMWRACDSRQLNAPCAFQNAAHDIYRGTCQDMADHRVCVRNLPIEHASTSDHAHPPEDGARRPAINGLGWLLGAVAVLAAGLGLSIWSKRARP